MVVTHSVACAKMNCSCLWSLCCRLVACFGKRLCWRFLPFKDLVNPHYKLLTVLCFSQSSLQWKLWLLAHSCGVSETGSWKHIETFSYRWERWARQVAWRRRWRQGNTRLPMLSRHTWSFLIWRRWVQKWSFASWRGSSYGAFFLSVGLPIVSFLLFFPPSFLLFFPSSLLLVPHIHPPSHIPSPSPFLPFFFSTQLRCNHLTQKHKYSGLNRATVSWIMFR